MMTNKERHSLGIGLFEILCPWKPRYDLDRDTAEFTPYKEYHYYLGGRAAGVGVWIIVAFIIAKLVQIIFW